MLATADQNHIDCEINGGCNQTDSELLNHRPTISQTLTLNAQQLQQQPSSQTVKQVVTQNLNTKKSVMLNLKSGAINSTVEEFEHFSTRFSDTFTQNRRRCQLWLLVIGIAFGCLSCFIFGLSFTHLFDARACDGESDSFQFLYLFIFLVIFSG